MTEAVFRQLQLTELEILDVFDKFCRDNRLKYSLYAGSLIGAVRHNGFIPWDDDIDVCMPRKDYDIFLRKWESCVSSDYYCQNYDINKKFTQSFTKIYKNNTTLLYSNNPEEGVATGINIDVFPVDRIPNGKIKRAIFKVRCMLYHLLLRKYPPQKGPLLVILVSKLILRIRNPERDDTRINKLLRTITKNNNIESYDLILIETIRSLKRIYPCDLFNNLTELAFETGYYFCFSNWDEKLRIDFGDYMTMPPVEERHPPHQAVLIDFENNYGELVNDER